MTTTFPTCAFWALKSAGEQEEKSRRSRGNVANSNAAEADGAEPPSKKNKEEERNRTSNRSENRHEGKREESVMEKTVYFVFSTDRDIIARRHGGEAEEGGEDSATLVIPRQDGQEVRKRLK